MVITGLMLSIAELKLEFQSKAKMFMELKHRLNTEFYLLHLRNQARNTFSNLDVSYPSFRDTNQVCSVKFKKHTILQKIKMAQ